MEARPLVADLQLAALVGPRANGTSLAAATASTLPPWKKAIGGIEVHLVANGDIRDQCSFAWESFDDRQLSR